MARRACCCSSWAHCRAMAVYRECFVLPNHLLHPLMNAHPYSGRFQRGQEGFKSLYNTPNNNHVAQVPVFYFRLHRQQ